LLKFRDQIFDQNEMRKLDLNDLKKGMPGVSEAVGNFLAEAATVCLSLNGHHSGVKLEVEGTYQELFEVIWQEVPDESIINSWKDLKEAAEYGATAIALLLMLALTDYDAFVRVPQQMNADYVLIKTVETQGDEPAAYLEISGIFQENSGNTIRMRFSAKERQLIEKNTGDLPVLIVVAEFSIPKAKISAA
jgi:hypothetical protein